MSLVALKLLSLHRAWFEQEACSSLSVLLELDLGYGEAVIAVVKT